MEEVAEYIPALFGTVWAIIPPLVAICLALITKEVYSSLFVGIVLGGILYAGGSFTTFLDSVFKKGIVGQLSDSYNVGILVFLVILGTMVALMNKAGGSAAFGSWAKKHIKTKVGAQIATICLGILIFIDDYFNCLTVGSVMRPVTDKHKVSREKLAYLIDATAAPICIIAPISSWAAAVAGFVKGDENGFALFVRAIPYNFYALFTILFMFILVAGKIEFGSMKKCQELADLATGGDDKEDAKLKGSVFDLIFPIVVLIASCVVGMIYSGGFFTEGSGFIDSFANSDASVGLMLGSFAALVITIAVYSIRRVLSFRDCMSCIPEGFKAMVPAILILTLAWTLKGMTSSLGIDNFIQDVVGQDRAGELSKFLPAVIFVIAVFLAFSTGTSWGTFGILIPICIAVFPNVNEPLCIISISACMAGAVCGDHCSPISDTTIMASAGAQCEHVKHVSTQLPYALFVAAISFVSYIIAGFAGNAVVPLIAGAVLLAASLFVVKKITAKA
ncbi:MAG: Na+/H+ antiporter NhaC family protein [Treponema sp.]|nr:Na+/H+ antiporter NhaC family protein [Treponema sp.]